MIEHTQIHTVVVGAGVVGLSIARELALRGNEVAILEAEPAIGSITSARNSGVIHAGLYYTPGSLKARLCVEGRDRLYAYARERNICHKQYGKLVVAANAAQAVDLHALKKNAETNGVTDLRLLTAAEARQMEPELSCFEAMHVPISGVIDVHGLLNELRNDAENGGAVLLLRSKFVRADVTKSGAFTVYVGGTDNSEYAIDCQCLINAAGLGAQETAAAIEGYDNTSIPEQVLGKGSYFYLHQKQAPFSQLIYPMPTPGTLGLHYRLDHDGRSIFGPDLELVDAIDFRVDPTRADLFYKAIRQYYPNVCRENLVPDYAGIRPKLKGHSDFMIQTEAEHHIPGLIHCFGIESPGITSCMALGNLIADQLSLG